MKGYGSNELSVCSYVCSMFIQLFLHFLSGTHKNEGMEAQSMECLKHYKCSFFVVGFASCFWALLLAFFCCCFLFLFFYFCCLFVVFVFMNFSLFQHQAYLMFAYFFCC